jgi:putative PIN family toxin of toxin-antitoxin system
MSILEQASAGKLRIDISDPIIDEVCGVMREKFKWDGYRIADAYHKMRAIGHLAVPTETLKVIKEDPDDDRILECAAAAKSDYIVSEDNDLLRMGNFRGTKIVTMQGFVAAALGEARRR